MTPASMYFFMEARIMTFVAHCTPIIAKFDALLTILGIYHREVSGSVNIEWSNSAVRHRVPRRRDCMSQILKG